MASFQKTRWSCLIASLIICVCAGFGYAWSVLQTPIVEAFGWQDSSVSLAYTITVLCSTMAPLLFAPAIRQLGTRRCIMLGAVLFGGGLITDLAKYSKLDEAQSRINELQSDLNRYRAELADVMLQADIQVDIGDFLRFADYFFDDVFSSWAVLDCIRNTAQQAASARQKVLQIQDRLSAARAQLEQETAALDQQHRTLVLEG